MGVSSMGISELRFVPNNAQNYWIDTNPTMCFMKTEEIYNQTNQILINWIKVEDANIKYYIFQRKKFA